MAVPLSPSPGAEVNVVEFKEYKCSWVGENKLQFEDCRSSSVRPEAALGSLDTKVQKRGPQDTRNQEEVAHEAVSTWYLEGGDSATNCQSHSVDESYLTFPTLGDFSLFPEPACSPAFPERTLVNLLLSGTGHDWAPLLAGRLTMVDPVPLGHCKSSSTISKSTGSWQKNIEAVSKTSLASAPVSATVSESCEIEEEGIHSHDGSDLSDNMSEAFGYAPDSISCGYLGLCDQLHDMEMALHPVALESPSQHMPASSTGKGPRVVLSDS
ncbi:RE1-silencing transcription factor [Heterocephalus glaber]|uniref:RE1-silencing transcription factor n=1 Tax=Heterocephalus glaber TaxID=10181 RepID=G5C775_HETGA|nr:RE1-silencing transcription factor [Heterocephalus glaber]